MSFSEILRESVKRVDGAVSAMILGIDGMPVEQYTSEKLINLEDLSAESSQMMKDINNAASNLGLGTANEFSIISDLCGILLRKINADYYFALIIKPDGNFGKARFVLRSLIPRIEKEF
jgi:predicted regulator of Ras-like GTPase activity (Roadblock/LC7/MglB family)